MNGDGLLRSYLHTRAVFLSNIHADFLYNLSLLTYLIFDVVDSSFFLHTRRFPLLILNLRIFADITFLETSYTWRAKDNGEFLRHNTWSRLKAAPSTSFCRVGQ